MTGKPTPGPVVDETALLFAEALTASRKLSEAGYDGLEAIKALPEMLGVCKRLLCVATEAGAWHPERFEADRDKAIAAARALLDRLTKKGDTDDDT